MDPSPHRKIGIAVDLSDESAYALRWAVQNYLRPGDSVILLHVRPTSVLYGADWGSVDASVADDGSGRASEEAQLKREEDFDAFTASKAQELAQPLVDAGIPFKIHVVKDHDMKERLCLEIERLGPNAVIMGSRGLERRERTPRGGSGVSAITACITAFVPLLSSRYPDDPAPGSPAKVFQSEPTILEVADEFDAKKDA